jgi:MFS family permease
MKGVSPARRALVAAAAALALADASIVALALPPILVDFDTTITGVAAIVGVYALALAVAILPARRLRPGPAGMFVFAAGSVGCALAPSLGVLLAFRALQAAGAAAALLSAYAELGAGGSGRRWWLGAALVGTAAGPALGGVLTELLDWRAIFAVQAPIAVAAGFASLRPEVAEPASRPHDPEPLGSLAALALTAAAFTAVLFLLVIELVAGFAISPLRAALGVTVLPLAAVAALLIPGDPKPRALAGALLLTGGGAALAFLPAPTIAWTIVPQILAGLGMGLALPALSPDRDLGEAATTLFARHVGIVVVLAILAPVATNRLTEKTDQAILQGASLVLDAQIDPLKKLQLAPGLLGDVNEGEPRGSLRDAVDERRAEFADSLNVYNRLARRLDDVVVAAVKDAFQIAYLIAAALALIAAALLASAFRKPAIWLAAAVAAGCVAVYAVEAGQEKPPEVVLADPCKPRDLPNSGGITGALQTRVLTLLDQQACKLGVSREELALAVFDSSRAQKFQSEHGVDPRAGFNLLDLLGG